MKLRVATKIGGLVLEIKFHSDSIQMNQFRMTTFEIKKSIKRI